MVLRKLARFFGRGEVDATRQPEQKIQCASELVLEGNAYLSTGKLDDALRAYRMAAIANPKDALAYLNQGYILCEQGQLSEAQTVLQQSLALDSGLADAHYLLGVVAQRHQCHAQAREQFSAALALNPALEMGYVNLGRTCVILGDFETAEHVMCQGIERYPTSASLLTDLGSLYAELNRPALVLHYCERALHVRPGNVIALSNAAVAHTFTGAPEMGEALLLEATASRPDDPDLWVNLGMAQVLTGQWEGAQSSYVHAISIAQEHAAAHFNLGLLLLLTGDFERGWREHEWRLRQASTVKRLGHEFIAKEWTGFQPIARKNLLIYAEQGLGDTLQFCRFVTDVVAMGAKVTLEVQRGIRDLVETSAATCVVIEMGEERPAFDLQCSLMSLPYLVARHAQCRPHWLGAYVSAAPHSVKRWRARLEGCDLPQRPRVGLVWSGNAGHRRDRDRSIALAEFLGLLPADLSAIALQPEVRDSDREALQRSRQVHSLGAEIANFEDTAAIIENLDVVVSVDTSVVHLAGAMGKPVWVLLPWVPDWRWGVHGNSTDWYPSIRLFRQKTRGDWLPVLSEVREALSHWR